ncbi:hypothetical protein Hanom_Chr15g01362621 [Helianthus anomalus]
MNSQSQFFSFHYNKIKIPITNRFLNIPNKTHSITLLQTLLKCLYPDLDEEKPNNI